jgi:hypothetical protein
MSNTRRAMLRDEIKLDLGDFGEREEYETVSRGYLSTASVCLSDGTRIPVFFYDMVRLAQDFESERDRKRAFLAEPGMIILDEVTRANMEEAVRRLGEEGFFESFRR